jgi:hypothetical protein
MMIIGNQNHMELAARVLTASTINMLAADLALKGQGRKILGRWAVNQPEELKALEATGYLNLYTILINQQLAEQEALLDNQNPAISEMEIMSLVGISMSLPTSY